jgi:hypothetical protein
MMNQGTAPVQSSARFAPIPVAESQMTFMDLLQQMASDANLEFLPLNKRHSTGREIFKLGKRQVYVNDGVVFMYDKNASKWDAVSVDDAIDKGLGLKI